jgi:hypothetical protein
MKPVRRPAESHTTDQMRQAPAGWLTARGVLAVACAPAADKAPRLHRVVGAVCAVLLAATAAAVFAVQPARAGGDRGLPELAYTKDGDLWLVRADGTERRRLIGRGDPAPAAAPLAWSPDARWLV